MDSIESVDLLVLLGNEKTRQFAVTLEAELDLFFEQVKDLPETSILKLSGSSDSNRFANLDNDDFRDVGLQGKQQSHSEALAETDPPLFALIFPPLKLHYAEVLSRLCELTVISLEYHIVGKFRCPIIIYEKSRHRSKTNRLRTFDFFPLKFCTQNRSVFVLSNNKENIISDNCAILEPISLCGTKTPLNSTADCIAPLLKEMGSCSASPSSTLMECSERATGRSKASFCTSSLHTSQLTFAELSKHDTYDQEVKILMENVAANFRDDVCFLQLQNDFSKYAKVINGNTANFFNNSRKQVYDRLFKRNFVLDTPGIPLEQKINKYSTSTLIPGLDTIPDWAFHCGLYSPINATQSPTTIFSLNNNIDCFYDSAGVNALNIDAAATPSPWDLQTVGLKFRVEGKGTFAVLFVSSEDGSCKSSPITPPPIADLLHPDFLILWVPCSTAAANADAHTSSLINNGKHSKKERIKEDNLNCETTQSVKQQCSDFWSIEIVPSASCRNPLDNTLLLTRSSSNNHNHGNHHHHCHHNNSSSMADDLNACVPFSSLSSSSFSTASSSSSPSPSFLISNFWVSISRKQLDTSPFTSKHTQPFIETTVSVGIGEFPRNCVLTSVLMLPNLQRQERKKMNSNCSSSSKPKTPPLPSYLKVSFAFAFAPAVHDILKLNGVVASQTLLHHQINCRNTAAVAAVAAAAETAADNRDDFTIRYVEKFERQINPLWFPKRDHIIELSINDELGHKQLSSRTFAEAAAAESSGSVSAAESVVKQCDVGSFSIDLNRSKIDALILPSTVALLKTIVNKVTAASTSASSSSPTQGDLRPFVNPRHQQFLSWLFCCIVTIALAPLPNKFSTLPSQTSAQQPESPPPLPPCLLHNIYYQQIIKGISLATRRIINIKNAKLLRQHLSNGAAVGHDFCNSCENGGIDDANGVCLSSLDNYDEIIDNPLNLVGQFLVVTSSQFAATWMACLLQTSLMCVYRKYENCAQPQFLSETELTKEETTAAQEKQVKCSQKRMTVSSDQHVFPSPASSSRFRVSLSTVLNLYVKNTEVKNTKKTLSEMARSVTYLLREERLQLLSVYSSGITPPRGQDLAITSLGLLPETESPSEVHQSWISALDRFTVDARKMVGLSHSIRDSSRTITRRKIQKTGEASSAATAKDGLDSSSGGSGNSSTVILNDKPVKNCAAKRLIMNALQGGTRNRRF